MKREQIAKWFKKKNFTLEEIQAIGEAYQESIIEQTDKAYHFIWFTKYGSVSKWIPKAVLNEQKKEFDEKLNNMINKRVNHKSFGLGTVIGVECSALKVKFDNEYEGKDERIILERFLELIK